MRKNRSGVGKFKRPLSRAAVKNRFSRVAYRKLFAASARDPVAAEPRPRGWNIKSEARPPKEINQRFLRQCSHEMNFQSYQGEQAFYAGSVL